MSMCLRFYLDFNLRDFLHGWSKLVLGCYNIRGYAHNSKVMMSPIWAVAWGGVNAN